MELVLLKAKDLSRLANLEYEISTVEQCNSVFFRDIYKSLTGLNISCSGSCSEDERCQIVIDSLEEYLSPCVPLDHIHGFNLAHWDAVTMNNLLDIFLELFKSSCVRLACSSGTIFVVTLTEFNSTNLCTSLTLPTLSLFVYMYKCKRR